MILACGLYDIALAIFHVAFWRLFGWPSTLRASGDLNTAITQTLNVTLTYGFAVYGGWLVWSAHGGLAPPAGALFAGAGFWLLRTALQPALFGWSHPWSVAITIVFAAGGVIHLAAALAAAISRLP